MAAQTSKLESETKLIGKELLVRRLGRDRCWFVNREKEEREEKEREREAHEDEKVASTLYNNNISLTKSHSKSLTVIHALSVFP